MDGKNWRARETQCACVLERERERVRVYVCGSAFPCHVIDCSPSCGPPIMGIRRPRPHMEPHHRNRQFCLICRLGFNQSTVRWGPPIPPLHLISKAFTSHFKEEEQISDRTLFSLVIFFSAKVLLIWLFGKTYMQLRRRNYNIPSLSKRRENI